MTAPSALACRAISQRIVEAAKINGRDPGSITLVAVSKTFEGPHIRPVLAEGQVDFGENRVQEAKGKWPELVNEFPATRLHLIGPLQTNKAADAVRLFDAIHSLDRLHLAAALAKEMRKQGRSPQLFIQVNTGEEAQKAGVSLAAVDDFVKACLSDHGLQPVGLMCIPPVNEAPDKHFALLADIAARHGFTQLSMGMSADFETAIRYGATHVRVGSSIFGAR